MIFNNVKCNLPKIIFVISLMLFLMFSAISYVQAVSANLQNSVFRLHVLANSDSSEDQELKLKVRDSLINYMNQFSFNSKEEALSFVSSHLENFTNIAENTIKESGYSYPVSIEVGNFDFPTKSYGDISLPAGNYNALRVKIGNANGHNWWCVMFPPLCFVDVNSGIVPEESKETLSENLSEEDYNLISSQSTFPNVKFKIVELINDLSIKLAQK